MADTYTTTNLKLVLPVVSQRVGPLFASDLDTALGTTLDNHDHTADKGARIPIAGITWGADFAADSTGTAYSATGLKSSNYTAQSTVTAARSAWFKTDNNFYITDGSGNIVQITSGGNLNTGAIVTNVFPKTSISGNHTIGASDTYTHVRCSPPGGGLTVTLPAANAVTDGRYYVISDVNGTAASNNITVTRAGSDLIEGQTTTVLNTNYGSIILVSEGSSNRWKIAAANKIPTTPVTNVYEDSPRSSGFTIGSSDTYVHIRCSPSAPMTVTLPAASAVTTGRFYVISDVTGVAATNNITVQRAGSDTIEGATSYVINVNRGSVTLVSEGSSNRWKVVGAFNESSTGVITSDASGAIINAAQIDFASNYTSPLWSQRVRTTNGDGASMTIRAQSGLGTNQAGGHLYLFAGARVGSGAHGRVLISPGNGASIIDAGDLGGAGASRKFLGLFTDGSTSNIPSTGDRFVFLQNASVDPGTPANGFVIWADSSAGHIAFKGSNGHRVSFSGFSDSTTPASGPLSVPSTCEKWWRVNIQGTTYRVPLHSGA